MTDDDIIRMAREAGWSGLYVSWAEPTGKPDWKPVREVLTVPVTMAQICRFFELAQAATREECAKVCKELDNEGNSDDYRAAARWCAERVRAMGDDDEICKKRRT